MTRNEEIQKAAIETRCAVATSVSGDNYCSIDDLPFIDGKLSYDELIEEAFVRGAEYADTHPAKKQAITIDWYLYRFPNGTLSLFSDNPADFITDLNEDDFPKVTFENSPKKVKITIELEDE